MSLFNPSKAAPPASTSPRQPAPTCRRGVLLVNTGTPERPDVPSIRRYLAQFLSDPLVIQLPAGLGWLQGVLGRLLARFRAGAAAEHYRRIWTDRGSPLKAIMEDQAAALSQALRPGWRVFVAMRYDQPGIEQVIGQIAAAGTEELVVVPLYPQYSRTTTGTVIQELYRVLAQTGQPLNFAVRAAWYDDARYVNAQARLIADCAGAGDLTPADTHLLFSAHGLPVSYIRRGDPYLSQVQRTVELVRERLGWPAERSSLAFQSRLGPAEWLKPDTADRLSMLAEAGERQVLLCPISFTVDCLETLEEIGVRYRESFASRRGRLFLCPALNTYAPFIAALKSLVLHGPRPVSSSGPAQRPLLAPQPEAEPAAGALEALVMIGVSLDSGVGGGRGPRLRYSDPGALRRVKKPQEEVHAFLRKIEADGSAHEAVVWNTCQRLEFYAWLKDPRDVADRECAIARIRQQLFGSEPEGLFVNVLFGVEAWHHMMRTISGLNSALPGDADVAEQLQTALRVAEHAGTAGPRAQRLLAEAVTLSEKVRAETSWGRFCSGYCLAALARVREAAGLELADSRHLVIGGSTTSRSVLDTLANGFEVPRQQMTLAYRGHGNGQMKLLRKAIGNGKRLRVQSYGERNVVKAITEADVVFFGIDHDQPVLEAADLRGIRDFSRRPLAIIDFNTFDSIRGVEELEGVTYWGAAELEQEVAAYAEQMRGRQRFREAVDAAEEWIEGRLPSPPATAFEWPCMKESNKARPACGACRQGAAPGSTTGLAASCVS